jgi:hypothetical protein
VKVPNQLSDDQRRLLKELAAAGGEDVSILTGSDKGFIGKVFDALSSK